MPGNIQYLDENWSQTKDACGRIKRLTGTITGHLGERKRAEEERRLNDARMEQAFGSSPIGMALIDVEGKSITCQSVLLQYVWIH